jgi:glycosyltransferase involved in cell wall biosynthesis
MTDGAGILPMKKVLYIGGFELPDKNAAAQRVIGIGKALKELGYIVCFLNSLKDKRANGIDKKYYFGFECYECQRENEFDYLLSGATVLKRIQEIKPDIIIAYNYPAYSLDKIRKYCRKNNIKCYADATEWYQAFGSNPIYRFIKNVDTSHRMKVVQKKLDGIIAISRYLYDFYKEDIKTIMLPPVVDLNDDKWKIQGEKSNRYRTFVYAGSPSAQKEKLDLIVNSVEQLFSEYLVELNVVGVTEDQFISIYNWDKPISDRVKFWGRIEHNKVIQIIKSSDWSVILRDNNQVVKAGFPTKLVESISCGTPVIVNEFSNIKDYLDETNSIIISNYSEIGDALVEAISKQTDTDAALFDYHQYLDTLKAFFAEDVY